MQKALAHIQRAEELLSFGTNGKPCGRGMYVPDYTQEGKGCEYKLIYAPQSKCARKNKCITHQTYAKFLRQKKDETSTDGQSRRPHTAVPPKKVKSVKPEASLTKETAAEEAVRSKNEEDKDQKKISSIKKMETLRNIYDEGWEFPGWVIGKVKQNYDKLMKNAKVYYPSDHLGLVKNLLKYREPVNIAMDQHFDKKLLKTHFGCDKSFYQTYWNKHKRLAPNIAVYTPTYVDHNGNTNTLIHVLNCIGYAFDDKRQPDYKYFISEATPYIKKNRTEILIDKYEKIFELMVRCAKDLGFDQIVVCLVGGNAFADIYETPDGKTGSDAFQETVWAPAFINVAKRNAGVVRWRFMGAEGSTALRLVQKEFLPMENIGRFPELLDHEWLKRPTLLANAWDSHTVGGNGNARDVSIDGHFGRRTNIAVNSTAMTNPDLQYIPV